MFCQNTCQDPNAIRSYESVDSEQSRFNSDSVKQHIFHHKAHQDVPLSTQQRQVSPFKQQHPYQQHTLRVLQQNKQRQAKKVQAIERNQHIASLITVVITFAQRIQKLKEKICGYPADSFSPVKFFNVLDLDEKGYVNAHDVWRFIDNQKVREKDIMILFKKVNGDHCRDCTRLSYFGFLNLVKPYFNEKLAKNVLSRDTTNKYTNNTSTSNNQILQGPSMDTTQQTVLLLFQELMLLHCISTTQHQQAKQLLTQEHMLNTMEIKQIMTLDPVSVVSSDGKTVLTRVKKPILHLIHDFISKNSQFEVQLEQMKYLKSALFIHEFSFANDKYLAQLFLPTNYSAELQKQIQRIKKQYAVQTGQQMPDNYFNTHYISKNSLMNRGNSATLANFFDQKQKTAAMAGMTTDPYLLAGNGALTDQILMRRTMNSTGTPNFLNFVHPLSVQRPLNIPQPQPYSQQSLPTHINSSKVAMQHPELRVNLSDKNIVGNLKSDQSRNQSQGRGQRQNQFNQQQNDILIPVQASIHNNKSYEAKIQQNQHRKPSMHSVLTGRSRMQESSVGGSRLRAGNYNISQVGDGNLTILGQFMRQSNVKRNMSPQSQRRAKVQIQNPPHSNLNNSNNAEQSSMSNSSSAFEVIDYGYDASSYRTRNPRRDSSYVIPPSSNRKAQSSRKNKANIDSRYEMIVSQYKNTHHQQPLKTILQQHSRQLNNAPYQESSYDPYNHQQQLRPIPQNPYLSSASMSESGFTMDRRSNAILDNRSNGGILNDFMLQ